MTPYYEDRFVTLYHGDCLDVMPHLGTMEGFDLVFTSPPYNLGGRSNHDLRSSRPRESKRYVPSELADGYGMCADDLPWIDYVHWQKRVLLACWDLLGDDGAIFYNHKPILRDRGARLPTDCLPNVPVRQVVIWDRGSGFNFERSHYCPRLEWIVVMAKRGWNLRDRGASKATDYWRIDFEQGTPHPAPFPLALPAKAIETTGAERVLDPFCGSGTTLLAAKRAGASAVGIEIEERFCEMAAMRLSQDVLPLFDEAGS